jgi:hypothetical protein
MPIKQKSKPSDNGLHGTDDLPRLPWVDIIGISSQINWKKI